MSVLNCKTLRITTTQGRRMLVEDPNGDLFPWQDPSIQDILTGPLLKPGSTETVDFSTLKSSVKTFYFGAKWCPPSRTATKQLLMVYEKLRNSKHPFEIIFCSLDRSKSSFEEHFSTLPWLAFPYNDKRLHDLTRLYDINGIF